MSKWFGLVCSHSGKRSATVLDAVCTGSKVLTPSKRSLFRYYSSSRIVGILDECYNKWERRAPLCPSHVGQLVKEGIEVLVEPSHSRIFVDKEYEAAGAKLTNDLSPCSLILGVKQPNQARLYPDKSYMFFAHVIKGQQDNRALLQRLLDLKIRLFDYECIRDTGSKTAPRLVAFGKFAGIAGMIDTFPALGQKLLAHGYSTPFLNCGSAYMYRDLDAAQQAVEAIGREIAGGALSRLEFPLVFTFTGNGNVSRGAQEIFKLLPHKMVDVSELPALWAQRDGHHQVLYGCVVRDDSMVRLRGAPDGARFDVAHYRAEPHLYDPAFHERVAPYTTVLVNGIYWDQRFPRLLTKRQLADLHRGREEDVTRPILVVADLSCDIQGSIEFLERSTHIERPYFDFDPQATPPAGDAAAGGGGGGGGAVVEEVRRGGVTIMGVDILPSELPREASGFFGDRLAPIVRDVMRSEGQSLADLPKHIANACITDGGVLTPDFRYISTLMEQRGREAEAARRAAAAAKEAGEAAHGPEVELRLHGHLFDSGLINQVLGIVEASGVAFSIAECLVRQGQKTSVILTLDSNGNTAKLDSVITKVDTLARAVVLAEATLVVVRRAGPGAAAGGDTAAADAARVRLHGGAGGGYIGGGTCGGAQERQTVLVLGAGRVASSLVAYLGKDPRRRVVVASALLGEAEAAARLARHGVAVQLELGAAAHGPAAAAAAEARLGQLVREASVVVSLLPAGLHAGVARACLRHPTHLITSSYVSAEMRSLHREAEAAGVLLLNEAGLDPGMDHMSAMRIIHDVQGRGGRVTHFSSVCGGLPAPEAADNPLRYKFSWSPAGVLAACENAATWRRDGALQSVRGEDLLASATPVEGWPGLRLECLPNRDSLAYEALYGIEGAATVFRGTLRYAGFSAAMRGLQRAGLLRDAPAPAGAATWDRVLAPAAAELPAGTAECVKFLGLDAAVALTEPRSVRRSFCRLLEEKLRFREGERDMVLMRHEIRADMGGGVAELHTSRLEVYGDERATAMNKTVGLTAGVCAALVLEGRVPHSLRGVATPTAEAIYRPALEMLAAEGLEFEETRTVIHHQQPADGSYRAVNLS